MFLHVRDQTRNVQELRDRRHFFRFFVDHHRRSDTAVRVTTAGNLSPFGVGTVNEIREIGKGAHQAEIGNQSRVGSVMPTCFFTSCARCDKV